MSGGAFDYDQYRINNIAESIRSIIDKNNVRIPDSERDSWSPEFYYEYPDDIIEEFKRAEYFLRKAAIYAHRVDYLVSGDDGEDSFRKRLKEELDDLERKHSI